MSTKMMITPNPSYNLTIQCSSGSWQSHGDPETLADPFVSTQTEVTIDFWSAIKQLLRFGRVRVAMHFNLSGNQDAYGHVMNIRPLEVWAGAPASAIGSEPS